MTLMVFSGYVPWLMSQDIFTARVELNNESNEKFLSWYNGLCSDVTLINESDCVHC